MNQELQKKNKKTNLIWIILGVIGTIIGGIIVYFALTSKENEAPANSLNNPPSISQQIQSFQNQISQIETTLNKPENSGKKVGYSVWLTDAKSQLNELPKQNTSEQEKVIKQLESKIKEVNQDLGIKEEPRKRSPNPKPKKPDKPEDTPPREDDPDKNPPPSNNLESERQRIINELENSCEEKEPKLPKKVVQKFIKQINNASLTELPNIFQQGQDFIQKKRAEREWWNLFYQEAERRSQNRNTSVEEIKGNSDITKLVEKIKRNPSTFSSEAKLTESEAKGTSTDSFGQLKHPWRFQLKKRKIPQQKG